MTIDRLFWLPLLVAVLHIAEEFVWPGGFARWYRWYRPDIAATVTGRFLAWINFALICGCLTVAIDGPSRYGVALFLTMIALLFANGVFHLSATLKRRRYAPGLVTGTLLYLPLGIVGYIEVLRLHRASIGTAFVAAVLGNSYQWVSWTVHKRRVRRMRARS